MNPKKDYYKILGIAKDAKKEEIKMAWRKLVIIYHPDKNPDNPEAEEKIKEINEAYEVLYNEISRHVYTQYRQEEEKLNQKKTQNKTAEKPYTNKRTYERKTKVRTERKIYVTGTISLKYWAELESDNFLSKLTELNYRINPVSAEATVTESDIHPFDPPRHFQKSYSQVDLLKSPVPQPVKCKVATSTGEELYDLRLEEIRIIDPALIDITKHENQSLGTLKGKFYAYILQIDEKEIIEPVTECFGETGKFETKTENGNDFIRKEYYHIDCSVYWGYWEQIKRPVAGGNHKKKTTPSLNTITADGCAQWWWIPILVLGLFFWPKVILGLILLGLILFILSLGISYLSRFIPFLVLLLIGFIIYTAFKSSSRTRPIVKREWRTSLDSIRTTKKPIVLDTSEGDKHDTLINQLIVWKDYDSISYSITLSVLTKDVRSSAFIHDNTELSGMANTLAPVYSLLEKSDQTKMERTYVAFDSIRKVNNLGETGFAKMVVSCIQSIPYYLVMTQSCNADSYPDEFIYEYLKECTRECCIGYEKFGIRSPVEFISDLKGDCDTRSLIIYSILKKFNYNVAIISSEYYKHAMIAVSFENEDGINGLSMNINDRNYYLWETTSAGFQPGQIPDANRNLSYWDIALLNEK